MMVMSNVIVNLCNMMGDSYKIAHGFSSDGRANGRKLKVFGSMGMTRGDI